MSAPEEICWKKDGKSSVWTGSIARATCRFAFGGEANEDSTAIGPFSTTYAGSCETQFAIGQDVKPRHDCSFSVGMDEHRE